MFNNEIDILEGFLTFAQYYVERNQVSNENNLKIYIRKFSVSQNLQISYMFHIFFLLAIHVL